MSTPVKRNPKAEAALLRYVKSSWRLLLADVDGDLWWSNSYVALKADAAMTAILSDYNLKPEPMVCTVGRTIVRTDQEPPDIAGLVPASLQGWKPVRPLTFGGNPLVVDHEAMGLAELWSSDGKTPTHTLNKAHLFTVYGHGGSAMLADPSKPHGPLARVDDDGKVVGLIMPIHTEASGELSFADGAKAAA